MTPIELSIEEIFKGKATMIREKRYFTTQQYVEPFIDRVDKLCQGNYLIKALPASQVSLTQNGEVDLEDTVFNRINIEAVLPGEYAFEGHQRCIGMVYGLDTRRPLCKFYVGALRSACTNLCVFNPEALHTQAIEPESAIDYGFVNHCMEIQDVIKEKLETMTNTFFDRRSLYQMLGKWIDNCINLKYNSDFGSVKIAESVPIDAYKDLVYNTDSEYYSNEDQVNAFNIYNAFTDILCNGKGFDIINKCEKVLLLNNILGL